jgi:hypothetical protein
MDTVSAVSAIARAENVEGAKDGLQPAALKTAVSVKVGGGVCGDAQGSAHIAVAPLLDVSLEKQAVQLSSAELLLELDLV